VNYCNGNLTTGWAYQFGSVCSGDYWQLPTWWFRMLQDPLFRDRLKCRWYELRQNVLSDSAITLWIDTTALYLDEGQARNFIQWPILGVYVWPNPNPLALTYAAEIAQLKSWILYRMYWLDNSMPGNLSFCALTGIDESAYHSSFSIFPNPNNGNFTVLTRDDISIQKIEVLDAMGRVVYSVNEPGNIHQKEITTELNRGIYFVRVSTDKNIFSSKIIVSK
jgi:hypothetical protein